MPKVVVVEIEVEDDDRNAVGNIANTLRDFPILNIGFKRSDVPLHGPKPTCRGTGRGIEDDFGL